MFKLTSSFIVCILCICCFIFDMVNQTAISIKQIICVLSKYNILIEYVHCMNLKVMNCISDNYR